MWFKHFYLRQWGDKETHMRRYELDEIASRLTEQQMLNIFYSAGCKEPEKIKVKSSGWSTIRCCNHNDEENKKAGKRASLGINVRTGAFRCMSCSYSGNLLTMAKRITGGNQREAYQLLYGEAGLSYDSDDYKPLPKYTPEKKEVEYMYFEPKKQFKIVELEKYKDRLSSMSQSQKYKFVLTAIYRQSLKTNQNEKNAYYGNRGISKNPKLGLIGFIPKGDSVFWKEIENIVGIDLLIEFGIYNAPDAKYNPITFKHDWTGPHCFIPSFDLYSDMLSGGMLRPVIKPKNGAKEFSLSLPSIAMPIPFALTNKALSGNLPIVLTEGSVDGLSFGEVVSKVEICSIPGIDSLDEELCGLFRGKTIIIASDMDRAGQDGSDRLRDKLLKAGATQVDILTWNPALGKDLNELLKSNTLKYVLQAFKMGASLLRV